MLPSAASLRLSVVGLLCLAATGCAASAGEVTSADSAELATARCPATLDVGLEKPVIAEKTPDVAPDGSPLSAATIGHVAAVMSEARALGAIRFPLALTGRGATSCVYEGTAAGGEGRRATLRRVGAETQLAVEYGAFRAYLDVTAVDADGVWLATGTAHDVYATVPLSGAFSEGATLAIPIGTTTVTPDAWVLDDHAFITKIADEAGLDFYWEPTELAASVHSIETTALPAARRAQVEARAAHYQMLWFAAPLATAAPTANAAGAVVSDESYEIVRDGSVIGYVLPIDHRFANGTYVAGAVRLFVDAAGVVVTERASSTNSSRRSGT